MDHRIVPARHARTIALIGLSAAMALGLALGSRAFADDEDNSGIVPPDAKIHGKTYGEWSARWWQWAYSLPVSHHPLFDTADVSAGQTGDVWFLGASFAPSTNSAGQTVAIVTRNVTIPQGKMLFFPIANAEASTAEGNGTTDAQLRAAAQGFQDLVRNMSCEIDGESVEDLDDFRVQSPLFTFTLPDDNILQFFGIDAPAGTKSLSVADGVYLMLEPLSVGDHTIHFMPTCLISTSSSISPTTLRSRGTGSRFAGLHDNPF